MAKDFSLEEALTPTPQEEFGLSDLFAAEEPAGVKNYVPRKTQGPARTVEGKTYPKPEKRVVSAPDAGVMGGEDVWAPVVEQQGTPYRSIMEGRKIPELPTEDRAVVNPKFVTAVEAQLNALPAEQRQAALDKMVQRQDVYGRAARAIAGRYAAMDKSFDLPTELHRATLENRRLLPSLVGRTFASRGDSSIHGG